MLAPRCAPVPVSVPLPHAVLVVEAPLRERRLDPKASLPDRRGSGAVQGPGGTDDDVLVALGNRAFELAPDPHPDPPGSAHGPSLGADVWCGASGEERETEGQTEGPGDRSSGGNPSAALPSLPRPPPGLLLCVFALTREDVFVNWLWPNQQSAKNCVTEPQSNTQQSFYSLATGRLRERRLPPEPR